MRFEPGTFGIFPANMCKGLHPYQQTLMAWLCFHSNREGTCYPSFATLIKETGISKASVARHLLELERIGYIQRSQRFDESGRQTSTFYTVILSNTETGQSVYETDDCPGERQGIVSERDTNYIHIEPKPKETNKNKSICSSHDELLIHFDRFWATYPRKVSKSVAKQVWIKKKLDNKADIIIADVEKRKVTCGADCWLNERKTFIPHPATYLNQERWEDEIVAEEESPPPNTWSKHETGAQEINRTDWSAWSEEKRGKRNESK